MPTESNLPTLPEHPFRAQLASWEPSERLAIQAYADAYAAKCRQLALESAAKLCDDLAAGRKDMRGLVARGQEQAAELLASLIRRMKD